MKRALLIAITLVLAAAPACKPNDNGNRTPLNPPLNVKINLSYEEGKITIDAPDPDPASIAQGDSINWVVTVVRGGELEVEIDDFADSTGKRVDVFGDGSTYKFGGVGSSPVGKPSGPARIVSGPQGFKYRITAAARGGEKTVLDPRIIVSAGLAH